MPIDKALPPRPSGLLERLSDFYLIPEGGFLGTWSKFTVALAVLTHLLITFQACFHNHLYSTFMLGYLLDMLFLVDMFFKSHTAYLHGGFWVVFPKEMRQRYISSAEFKFDLISNFPFDLMVLFGFLNPGIDKPTLLSLIRLLKLLRTMRVPMYFQAQELKLHASFSVQILKFLTYLIVLTHSIACVWYSLACFYGDGLCFKDSWYKLLAVVNAEGEVEIYNVQSLYIICIYWTVTTMTTTGYGDIRATNDLERIFVLCTMTVGIFFYGYVSGTIASTLSNMDSRRVGYQQKMDAVKQYMNTRDMDHEMQQRVIDYYDYVWERNRGIDVKNLFEDMPITFRSEVALSLNNSIIDKASIFHDCSIGFRRRIATSMRLYLFTANEYVVHKNDLGLEMYFITQGRIDIYASDALKKASASLIEGEYGVVLGNRHENSAKAICNTDIYVLTHEELTFAFEAYPEDKEKVIKATLEQFKKYQSSYKRKNDKTMSSNFDEFDDMEHRNLQNGQPQISGDAFSSLEQSNPITTQLSLTDLGQNFDRVKSYQSLPVASRLDISIMKAGKAAQKKGETMQEPHEVSDVAFEDAHIPSGDDRIV